MTQKQQEIRKCLFPVAGYSKRFDCGSFVEATNYFYKKTQGK